MLLVLVQLTAHCALLLLLLCCLEIVIKQQHLE
jgi:hypothetical protein